MLNQTLPPWYPQVEQMADLRKKWKKTKQEADMQHGTSDHLELPDILITHEMTYEAPPGKANADRPMPLPRTLVRLSFLSSLHLPTIVRLCVDSITRP